MNFLLIFQEYDIIHAGYPSIIGISFNNPFNVFQGKTLPLFLALFEQDRLTLPGALHAILFSFSSHRNIAFLLTYLFPVPRNDK